MAIVKSKPSIKKPVASTAKKPAATAVVKSAPKTAAAANQKLKAAVKKSFDPAGLGEYQSIWEGTEPAERGEFGDIPDGKYSARIEEAILDTGKNGDKLQVKWTLSITGPTHAKRKVWQNTGLMDEMGIQMTKGNLKVLGITIPADITDLTNVLAEAEGAEVEINLVTKEGKGANAGKEFQNVYVNKRIDGVETATAEEQPAAEATGDGEWAGKSVKFTHDDVEYTGTVVKDDGVNAEVAVDGQDDHWELALEILEEVEPTAEVAPDDFVGQYVSFEVDGEAKAGDVVGVDKDGNLQVEVDGEEWGVGVADATITEKPKAKAPVKKAAPAPVKAGPKVIKR